MVTSFSRHYLMSTFKTKQRKDGDILILFHDFGGPLWVSADGRDTAAQAQAQPRRGRDEQTSRPGERANAAGGGRQERSAVTGGRRREWRTTVSTRVLRDHGERTNVDRRAATGLVMPTSWRCIAMERGQIVYWHRVTV